MNLTTIPIQNDQIKFFRVDSEGILVHPQKGKIRVLNPTGTFIWEMIDGNISINEIITNLDKVYACHSDSLQSEVVLFLKELSERSIIYLKEE